MDYTQITEQEQQEMLDAIGVESIDALFEIIPEAARCSGELDLPIAKSELELQRDLLEMAGHNCSSQAMTCFMGAGAYDHFYPALIDQLILRGEFLTAYTPYQAEASQGSLQAFFEFQTQIARLSGLDIANASLYEGATALAEAAILAMNTTRRSRVLVAETIHPDSMHVLRTYLGDLGGEITVLPACGGTIDPASITEAIDGDVAAVIVQSPNIWGCIEDVTACFERAHAQEGTVAITAFHPVAAALLKSPGECGADIATAEGQPLGIPMSLGGPYCGLFAAKEKFARKMPGRLIGRTTDADGRAAYCLTLQTREQHIKGERATSNICTNQGLLALRITMFLTVLGKQGLRTMAEQCWHKAHYLAKAIDGVEGYALTYPDAPFFNEFCIECPVEVTGIIETAKRRGILAGVAPAGRRMGKIGTDRQLLIAVTEKRTKSEMDALVEVLEGARE
jgi:glycine dehydrogenase subunit 1